MERVAETRVKRWKARRHGSPAALLLSAASLLSLAFFAQKRGAAAVVWEYLRLFVRRAQRNCLPQTSGPGASIHRDATNWDMHAVSRSAGRGGLLGAR